MRSHDLEDTLARITAALARIEVALNNALNDLEAAQHRADRVQSPPGAAADEAAKSPPWESESTYPLPPPHPQPKKPAIGPVPPKST